MHHTAAILETDDIAHGFMPRAGGVSTGVYSSLNCGPGSNDNPDAVMENRRRAVMQISGIPHPLATLHQIHSAEVVTLSAPWHETTPRPQADAMVTRHRNIVLGILTADCCPVLFSDPETGVIGAAHAGWRGALAGIVPTTIKAMVNIGARIQNIRAGIGPTIAQQSYEVGAEVRAEFLSSSAANDRFFKPSKTDVRFLFDLPGYVAHSLTGAGVHVYENLGLDTYPADNGFFSYRRNTHNNEADYGRQLSAIMLR